MVKPNRLSRAQRARALAAGGVLLVAAIVSASAFALSFSALTDVAALAGVERSLAWLLPVCVDGAMVVGTAAWQWKQVTGCSWRARSYPALIVLIGAGLSVWINALHAQLHHAPALTTTTAMIVSALPALFLALSVHLVGDLLSGLLPRSLSAPATVSAHDDQVSAPREYVSAQPVSVPVERPTLTVVSMSAPDERPGGEAVSAVERVSTPAPEVSAPMSEALTWVTDQVRAGAALTGKQVGERFGVSAQTGRRWLATARTQAA